MAKFIEAVLILSGMIIGVGMFGIPFSFARVGFWVGTAELIILSGVVLLFHFTYGEVVLWTKESHRLPGYVRIYLGKGAEILARLSALFGITGTLLAYLLVGSSFLSTVFEDTAFSLSHWGWTVVMVLAGSAITLFPLKNEAAINGILTAALIGFILVLSFFLFPRLDFQNLRGVDFENLFIPYGVLLFALSGGVVIPDLLTLLGRDRRRGRLAIAFGTLIPASLYFIFTLAVVGSAGKSVSEEALRGLAPIAGNDFIRWGSVMGVLAVFTSYITLSMSFQMLLRLDLKFPKVAAWIAAMMIPFFLYTLGFRSFITIIGAVGAIAVGVDSALILAAHYILKKRAGIRLSLLSYFWRIAIYVMIGAGVIYELYALFGA